MSVAIRKRFITPGSREELRTLIDLVRVRDRFKGGDLAVSELPAILDQLERRLQMSQKWAVLSSYDENAERTAKLLSTDEASFEVVTFFNSKSADFPTPEEFSQALSEYGEGEQEYLIVPMANARAIKVNVEKRLEVISTGSYL